MLASELLARKGPILPLRGHHAIVRGVSGFEGAGSNLDLRGGAARVWLVLWPRRNNRFCHSSAGLIYEGFVENHAGRQMLSALPFRRRHIEG